MRELLEVIDTFFSEMLNLGVRELLEVIRYLMYKVDHLR